MKEVEETHQKNVSHITKLIHAIQKDNTDNGTSALVITGLNTLILMRICARLNIDLTDIDIHLEGDGDLQEMIEGMPKNLGGIS